MRAKLVQTSRQPHPLHWIALCAASLSLPALAIDNPRIVSYLGQTQPTVSAASATFSNTNATMTVVPIIVNGSDGNGLSFYAQQTYALGNSNIRDQGTTITIDPATNAVPYRMQVQDQRSSSWQYMLAECLDPANPTGPLIYCNLGDTSQFPLTHYAPASSPPFNEVSEVDWSTAPWLWIRTPGFWNQNRQSNGVFIDLPPTVRRISFYSINKTNGGDFTAGAVYVADAPSVSKSFAPASVQPGGQSTLTINLKGPGFGQAVPVIGNAPAGNGGVAGAVPGVNLTDLLPAPLTLVSASHNCTGGTFTAAPGSNSLGLANASIPNEGCTITAQVQWPGNAAGINACRTTPQVTNTITPPSQFSTLVGQMDTPASAALACDAPIEPPAPVAVPALGLGALLLTSGGVLGLGLLTGRKRRKERKHG